MILDEENAEPVGQHTFDEFNGRNGRCGARRQTGQDWPNCVMQP